MLVARGSQSTSCPVVEAHRKDRFARLRGAPRGLGGGFGLRQRQAARDRERRGRRPSARTPCTLRVSERHADLVFEIADLPAQRGLRRVQPLLGRDA